MVATAITVLLGGAATVAAQPISCGDCKKAATEAAPIRNDIKNKEAEQQRLQQERRANDANLNNVRRLRLEAARSGDTAAVKEHDQSIDDLQADNQTNAEQQFKTQQDIQSLNEQLEKIGRDVDACSKRCFETDPNLPTGFVGTRTTEIGPGDGPPPDGVSAPPLRTPPPCDDCKDGVAELEREHQELERRAKLANDTKLEGYLRDFEAQRRKVRDLQRKVDGCNTQCTPLPDPKTTSFLNPRVIGGAAGGAVLVALLAGGGGGDGAVLATPIANQPPPQQPVPPPQPPQPPPPQPPPDQPTIAGTADCTACAPVDDPGRQNAAINLCPQLTGAFDIAVASITIRHRAPFVDIVGAQYDAASGAFRGTARGTVAGIPNVGITAEGTANAQTGSIVFTYTMGTGGELPGGRAITYRITLQKRR